MLDNCARSGLTGTRLASGYIPAYAVFPVAVGSNPTNYPTIWLDKDSLFTSP